MLFEAPLAETVRDILAETGLIAFLETSLHFVTPIQELLKKGESIPTIYA